ncbi:hypothetical protein BT67DRAFT_208435 [Trichocladium antarcticum]|uniref:Uncharacterized protein n=1 Tax=Trichocladium antarcticum TaxID=1450529 RepID=A0AAN6ZAK5_9PEZI|nr:hypothetical protein BT67DRAFT_208435 [Trichocladium antarcticum]
MQCCFRASLTSGVVGGLCRGVFSSSFFVFPVEAPSFLFGTKLPHRDDSTSIWTAHPSDHLLGLPQVRTWPTEHASAMQEDRCGQPDALRAVCSRIEHWDGSSDGETLRMQFGSPWSLRWGEGDW